MLQELSFMTFRWALTPSETQKALSIIWIQFTDSISYNDNQYINRFSKQLPMYVFLFHDSIVIEFMTQADWFSLASE